MTIITGPSNQNAARRASIRRMIITIMVITVCLIVGFLIFDRLRSYSDARLVLREAKNIKMTLEMADLEYSGLGASIYDENAEGNIRSGALQYVKKIQGEVEGRIFLTGYDSVKKKITGFEYETEKYIVRYEHPSDGESWKIFQIKELNILNYPYHSMVFHLY